MSKVITYTRPDGGVSIIIPTGELPLELVLVKDVPADAQDVAVVDHSAIPQDRYFRNAWKQGMNKVEVDMPKAREIQMSKIREKRDQELTKLDTEWMKAYAQKKQAQADLVEAKKQAMRDIPQTFDLSKATTPEELKLLWPEELPRDFNN